MQDNEQEGTNKNQPYSSEGTVKNQTVIEPINDLSDNNNQVAVSGTMQVEDKENNPQQSSANFPVKKTVDTSKIYPEVIQPGRPLSETEYDKPPEDNMQNDKRVSERVPQLKTFAIFAIIFSILFLGYYLFFLSGNTLSSGNSPERSSASQLTLNSRPDSTSTNEYKQPGIFIFIAVTTITVNLLFGVYLLVAKNAEHVLTLLRIVFFFGVVSFLFSILPFIAVVSFAIRFNLYGSALYFVVPMLLSGFMLVWLWFVKAKVYISTL